MAELNWQLPDKDSTFNTTLIYKSTSKYGTYTLLTTISDIRITKYNDTTGVSTSWYKIRFEDTVNTVYSDYSLPIPASGTVSDTNYTTPKLVAQYLNNYRSVVAEAVGTGTGTLATFGPVSDPKVIADTETVYVDGVAKSRNTDYIFNYDTGRIVFATGSEPALGKAVTADYWASTYCTNDQYIRAIKRAEEEINRRLGRSFYQPQTITLYYDSIDPDDTNAFAFEPQTYHDSVRQFKEDAFTPYKSRVLKLKNYPINTMYQIIVNSQPTSVLGESVAVATGATSVFSLAYGTIVYESEIIYLNGVQVTNYTIDNTQGTITFGSPPTGTITADYTYCQGGVIISPADYLVRAEDGMIFMKNQTTIMQQNPFICAITYSYGYDSVPYTVEQLATLQSAVVLMQTTLVGSPTSQSIQGSNIGLMLGEIRSLYDTLGRRMELTRL